MLLELAAAMRHNIFYAGVAGVNKLNPNCQRKQQSLEAVVIRGM
jgi:hypothetical protein